MITNIDREHMESYGSWDALQQAFVEFANKVPFYGAVVACVDDGPVRALVPRMTRRVITYGFEESARHVDRPRHGARGRSARAAACGSASHGATVELGSLRLRVPGRHNLLNALGAVAVGLEVGVPFARIARGARGVPRRRAAVSAARRSRAA